MRIDLTRDDPLLPIDKVPLIIMTDGGFLLVKRQDHHRPAQSSIHPSLSLSLSLSLSSLFPAFCLFVAENHAGRLDRRLNANASDAIMRRKTDTHPPSLPPPVRGYERLEISARPEYL
jgi:hypothetical protein